MTEIRVIPNCRCSHAGWRHIGERYRCRHTGCGCLHYRPKTAPAPDPSPEEQSVIDLFDIFAEEEGR